MAAAVTAPRPLATRIVVGALVMFLAGLGTLSLVVDSAGLGRLLLLSLSLTLFAGLLFWWVLRHELARWLAATAVPTSPPPPDAVSPAQPVSLAADEQHYRALLEALPEAVVISRQGLRLYANPAAARLLGADSAAELVGQSIFDLISPEALAELTAQRDLFHGTDEKFTMEVRSRKRDGTPFDAEISGTPILHQGQKAVLTVTRDATARRAAERELRKLSLAVAQNPHSVVITDVAGRIEYVNEAFEQASGYRRASVLGQNMSLLRSGKTPSATYQSLWAALDQGQSWTGQFVNRRSNGQDYVDEAVITPLRQLDGQVSHYVAVQQDVTERVRLDEELGQHRHQLEALVTQRTAELTQAREQAESANNAKSRFLAAASHDLRQPLAALALYVGILKRPPGPPAAEVVDQIEHCVGQLSELLTDLLDLSKLDAGVVTPKLSDFALADALQPLLSIYGAKAQNKGLQLRCRPSTALVRTDVQWLSRLVGNLLDNAVEYTQQGGVLVACRRHQGRQWLEVWDTGVGIPPDQTGEVFEEFRQLGDQARTHGSGLGLSIVAKTAALLGLRLRLRSRPGRGSLFAIELPPGQAVAPVPSWPPQTAVAARLVAVVDDNPQVLAALTAAIETLGPQVIAAGSGTQLMQRLGSRVPDLVVSDYRLANQETGFEVIERLRSALGAPLPGIIVTGDTDPAAVRRMSAQGIAVLYKPLHIDSLHQTIALAMADSGLAPA